MDIHKYIADHSKGMTAVVTALITIWFFTGIVAIDYINPIVFLLVWIPTGLFASFFAYKW